MSWFVGSVDVYKRQDPFCVGDVVCLKSGGLPVTVVDVMQVEIIVAWFGEFGLETMAFPAAAFERASCNTPGCVE
jgi:uncharacterized protein YodC (DUF2158 family)